MYSIKSVELPLLLTNCKLFLQNWRDNSIWQKKKTNKQTNKKKKSEMEKVPPQIYRFSHSNFQSALGCILEPNIVYCEVKFTSATGNIWWVRLHPPHCGKRLWSSWMNELWKAKKSLKGKTLTFWKFAEMTKSRNYQIRIIACLQNHKTP